MSPLQRAFLDKRIDEERMRARDVRDDPPLLPAGARVEVMDHSGVVRPWAWADSVSWWEVCAWRTTDDGTTFDRCESCGEMAIDSSNRSAAETRICGDCWQTGDFEMDGDATDGGENGGEEAA